MDAALPAVCWALAPARRPNAHRAVIYIPKGRKTPASANAHRVTKWHGGNLTELATSPVSLPAGATPAGIVGT